MKTLAQTERVLPLIPVLLQARAAAAAFRSVDDQVTAALSPLGLSTARCLVLEALERRAQSSASISDLALFLGIHRTSVSGSVELLVASGLVRKTVDEHDSRKSRVHATAAGRSRLAEARQILTNL